MIFLENTKNQQSFMRATVKLLNKSIICGSVLGDKEDYTFIKENLSQFNDYFERMNLQILLRTPEKTVSLQKKDEGMPTVAKETWTNKEIAAYIVLREYYLEHMKVDKDEVIITKSDLIEHLPTFMQDEKCKSKELESILLKFKKHDLLMYNKSEIDNLDARIILYPSIVFSADDKGVAVFYEELKAKVEAYSQKKARLPEQEETEYEEED